jgi:hypothetical protein
MCFVQKKTIDLLTPDFIRLPLFPILLPSPSDLLLKSLGVDPSGP